jgi:DNA-directed RNA polymerase subunit RPC12/RpoP
MTFKNCPRCSGDVYVEDDLMGRDIVCLQCGHRQAVPTESPYSRTLREATWRDDSAKTPSRAKAA